LTELDGVEGLKGVVVIGATSRPDLIDAALLRPGRLDKLLYCGFPTTDERIEILHSLSRKLHMSKNVNLESLAKETEGFSGADLGALIADAQLIAAHQALEEAGQRANSILTITEDHITQSLSEARPSVSSQEKSRLESIYHRFRNSDTQHLIDADIGTKVTYA